MNKPKRRLVNATLSAAIGGVWCFGVAHWVLAQQIIPSYRDSDIRVLIEGVQAVTGRPMIVDPRVRANVTLYNSTPMTPEAFYQAFLQILEVHGYMAVESGGVVQILPDANARQVPGAGAVGTGADIVTQTITLRNVGAAQLVPILRPMMPQYGHLAAHQSANMLILSDRASNMTRMVDIINRIDRAGSEEIEVIPLENAAAGEVVRMLSTLTQASAAASGAPTVQAFADERTNSVLLGGPASMKAGYRDLISRLDTPSLTGGETLVRYLHYADAEDLATKLQAQYGAQVAAEGAAAGANAGTISIWPDPGTNALVINAPARLRQDMMAVLDLIDIRRAQVQVDAIIVEVSEEKAAELGLTWIADGSGNDEVVGLTNFSNTTGGILNLASISASDTPNPSAISQGITMAVGRITDTGTSWAAVLSALRGDASTNIISTPTIVALDNQEAEIRVGQEVPFLTGQFTSTGSSEGSVNPFQTIQREEVGTSLKITPQINEGTGVQLAIVQETSSIGAGAAGAVDIVTNKRSITTSVFVEDGDVLILGGLIDDALRQSEQRVPGLGRIPGLGWLFRARNTERVKTNLMVFIRPRILRDGIAASAETNVKYGQIRGLQQEQSDTPVRLLRGETHPMLPELPPVSEPPAGEPSGTPQQDPDDGRGEP
jgi:general secretion pathway protein D